MIDRIQTILPYHIIVRHRCKGALAILPFMTVPSAADIIRESFPLAVYPLVFPPGTSTVLVYMSLVTPKGSLNKAEILESEAHSCDSTFRHHSVNAKQSTHLNRHDRMFRCCLFCFPIV